MDLKWVYAASLVAGVWWSLIITPLPWSVAISLRLFLSAIGICGFLVGYVFGKDDG